MTYLTMRVFRSISLSLVMGGCATIERGTTQVVTIAPDPADAACTVQQGPAGARIAVVNSKVELPRSRDSLHIECTKPGFKMAFANKLSMVSEKPFGGLSYLVDISSGANYSYPPVVKLVLTAE